MNQIGDKAFYRNYCSCMQWQLSCFLPFYSYELYSRLHTFTPRVIVNAPTVSVAQSVGVSEKFSDEHFDRLYDGHCGGCDDDNSPLWTPHELLSECFLFAKFLNLCVAR
jgi:hypothetical protein